MRQCENTKLLSDIDHMDCGVMTDHRLMASSHTTMATRLENDNLILKFKDHSQHRLLNQCGVNWEYSFLDY